MNDMKTKYIYLLLAGIFALMSCEEDATPILELKTAAEMCIRDSNILDGNLRFIHGIVLRTKIR